MRPPLQGQRWLSVVAAACLAMVGCRSAVKDFYEPLTHRPECTGTGGAGGNGGSVGQGGIDGSAGASTDIGGSGGIGPGGASGCPPP